MSSKADEEKQYETINLQKSDEVTHLVESRHILDEEIKMVIHNAETTGDKLYRTETDKYLAKLRIANATFYVEYSVAGERTYIVHTAYSHRTELKG